MTNNDLTLLLDIPPGMDAQKMVGPVRGDMSPLGLLVDRMLKITSSSNIIILATMQPDNPYSVFTAMRGLFLSRVRELGKMERILKAVTGRGAKVFARIDARNVFADPDIIAQMYQLHIEKKSAHTRIEGVPGWLGAEAFRTDILLDAVLGAREANAGDIEPLDALAKYVEGFKPLSYRARVRGRWKFDNLALGDPQSEQHIISAIRSAPNPVALTHKDFLA